MGRCRAIAAMPCVRGLCWAGVLVCLCLLVQTPNVGASGSLRASLSDAHSGGPGTHLGGTLGSLEFEGSGEAGVVDCSQFTQRSALSLEEKQRRNLIVVMTYNRATALGKLLTRLATLPGAKWYTVVVTQSLPQEGADGPAAKAVREVVGEARLMQAFQAIKLTTTARLDDDITVATDRGSQHGSKRNAANNLLSGLQYAFKEFGTADTAIVLEDDAVVSCDMLEMFSATRELLLGPMPTDPVTERLARLHGRVHKAFMNSTDDHASNHAAELGLVRNGDDGRAARLATALLAFRPGLLDGNKAMMLRDYMSTPMPATLHRLKAVPRTVFKTFAWQLARETFVDVLEPKLKEMIAWKDPESLWPGFGDCKFCNNYCYDHLLEWTLQGEYYVGPDMGRVTQLPGEGMTYKDNPTNPIFSGFVHRNDFNATNGYYFLEWFPGVGLSGMANAGDGMQFVTNVGAQFTREPVIVGIALFLASVVGLVFCLKRLLGGRRGRPKPRSD